MMISPFSSTDFYEFTMAAAYHRTHHHVKAVFELICHTPPPSRPFLVAAGIGSVAQALVEWRIEEEDIAFLKRQEPLRRMEPSFFDHLRSLRFSGDVWAPREGEILTAKEPLLVVEAPIIEAQLLETYLLSMINIQTLVASKAHRICSAASGIPVVDFGARRAHGPEAGVWAARGAFIGGCVGTSNIAAGRMFDIPVFGTVAHSWIESFENEDEAFARYHEVFPDHTILLIDTYDTIEAARRLCAAPYRNRIKAVRIDSGDLDALSRQVRRILDEGGLSHVKILASGNLNEERIHRLREAEAPIDGFGVGTEMTTSRDNPALDLTYKLVQVTDAQGRVRLTSKKSPGKEVLPGRKQVYRFYDDQGQLIGDRLCLADAPAPEGGEPLFQKIIEKGRLIQPPPSATQARQHLAQRLLQLPREKKDWRLNDIIPLELDDHILQAASLV